MAGYDDGWIGYSAVAEAEVGDGAAVEIGDESGFASALEASVDVDAVGGGLVALVQSALVHVDAAGHLR